MPVGLPPRKALRIINRSLERSRFRVAKAVFEPLAEEDEFGGDDVSWGDYLRAIAAEFRRFARAVERAADVCDQTLSGE